MTRLELTLQSRAVSQFAHYLTAVRASEAYRSEILPRAEEAYRLYLSRYREMAAAYPQVLVAQRTLFEMSTEYLENLNDAWHAALSSRDCWPETASMLPQQRAKGWRCRTLGRGGER